MTISVRRRRVVATVSTVAAIALALGATYYGLAPKHVVTPLHTAKGSTPVKAQIQAPATKGTSTKATSSNGAVDPAFTTATATVSAAGVPAGTKLKDYNGNMDIKKAGTVISGLFIHGTVRVDAPNVTIKNSIIDGGPAMKTDMGIIYASSTYQQHLKVSHVEIYAAHPSTHVNGIMGSSFKLRNVNIHDVVDQVDVFGAGHVSIRNSWLHDNLIYAHDPAHNNGPSHSDNLQVQNGTSIYVSHNVMSGGNNSSMQVTQAQGKTSGLVVEWNWVSGGSCTFNVSQLGAGTPIKGLSIQNNLFGASASNCAMIIDSPTVAIASISGNASSIGKAVTLVKR